MYKTRLQELCQKRKWELPVYSADRNGTTHPPRFTATVNVQGQVFQSPEEFRSVKEAQNTAAQIAYSHFNLPLMDNIGLLPQKDDVNRNPANGQENYADKQTSAQHEGLYKSLLQQFAQKKGLLCPSYETVSSGMSHRPIFVSVVAIGADTFRGDEAKTKKQAEINVAKVAYFALTKVTDSSMVSTMNECPAADNLSQNIQATATVRKFHDTTNEEPDAKRFKAPPENSPWQQWKTVVIPRERSYPIPEDTI